MSQDTFPFAEGDDHETYVEEATNNRRVIKIVGGVAAALVVAGGGWFLLSGSGSSPTTASAFVPQSTFRHVAVGSHPNAATTATTLPAAYTAPLGRDPFKALYVVPVAAANPAAGSTTSTGPASTTGSSSATSGSTTGSSTPGGTTSGSTRSTGSATPAGSSTSTTGVGTGRYTVKLLAISKPSPQARFSSWAIESVTHTVLPAQRFGKYGEIEVLAYAEDSAGTVTGAIIQVGDDSPIDVAVGQSVSVL